MGALAGAVGFDSMSMDCSLAFKSGVKAVNSECVVLNDPEHIARKAKDLKGLAVGTGLESAPSRGAGSAGRLNNRKKNQEAVLEHIRIARRSRNKAEMSALLLLIAAEWRRRGEEEYAVAFMGVYADEEWMLWFDSASGTPGVAPTQQALESFNRRLKALAGSELNLDLYLGLIRLLPKLTLFEAIRTTGGDLRPQGGGKEQEKADSTKSTANSGFSAVEPGTTAGKSVVWHLSSAFTQ